jgi:hypothetical protein
MVRLEPFRETFILKAQTQYVVSQPMQLEFIVCGNEVVLPVGQPQDIVG